MDHSEKMALAVTKLGNPELFLGLDWLRNHNPSIDWAECRLSFDRCPDACGYTATLEDIECEPTLHWKKETDCTSWTGTPTSSKGPWNTGSIGSYQEGKAWRRSMTEGVQGHLQCH